ncbi:protein-L-isoaspartate(D-aspartate) O-methyltransferase [Candidatus Daviesbacteria bacterium]|nr:protein-L-isoaspartate(D-aspartate) O-methyltransferase [Candidatus Daviesbacteria bacterium]
MLQDPVDKKFLIEEYIKPNTTDPKIIQAFLNIPREEFVPPEQKDQVYLNIALPIGEGQTISQPSLVAQMTQLLGLTGYEKVLEIGTGSGYQAAILSQLAKDIYSIELLPQLAEIAKQTLNRLGYKNVHVFTGNGKQGLDEYAPYDAIIVTAAAKEIPQALVDQLKDGGRLVIPVGKDFDQNLKLGIKKGGQLEITDIEPVVFVPLK